MSNLTNYIKQHPGKGYYVACKDILGTGNDGVAKFEYNGGVFNLYLMLCDKQDLNYYFVSGDIQGSNIIPLQSMPCHEEALTENQVSEIETQLEQKFLDIGEEIEDFSSEPRTAYGNANVTMVCEL